MWKNAYLEKKFIDHMKLENPWPFQIIFVGNDFLACFIIWHDTLLPNESITILHEKFLMVSWEKPIFLIKSWWRWWIPGVVILALLLKIRLSFLLSREMLLSLHHTPDINHRVPHNMINLSLCKGVKVQANYFNGINDFPNSRPMIIHNPTI